MNRTLAGKTIFISGGSRGIGLAIALRAARDGANIAIAEWPRNPHILAISPPLNIEERWFARTLLI